MQKEQIIQCQFSTNRNKEMHFHQDIEVIYVLEGEVIVNYENSKKTLGTDDFLVINTNVRHGYESKRDVLIGTIFISFAQLLDMFQGEPVYFFCNSAEEKSESYDKMRYYIRQIFNYYHTDEGQGTILRTGIAYQLLYILTSEFIVKKGMRQYESLRGISDDRLNDILNYLTNNYQEQITLQGLADKLYLSNAYLSKYIKKNFGMSFLKLLNNIRMEHAVSELLYGDKTVVRIAMDNGFPNLAGFNRTFREIYHMTPAEYRKEMYNRTEPIEKGSLDMAVMERVDHYLNANQARTEFVKDISVISIEANAEVSEHISPNWNRMINVGKASDLLRYDIREQVRYLVKKLKFRYVRFWNVFSDEMLIQLDENQTRYNFNQLDKVFDFIVEIHAKPFLEVGFKAQSIYKNIGHKVISIDNMNQFTLIEKNQGFLVEFVKHLVKRYGIEEVETWYVEMEKNSVVEKSVDPLEYTKAFKTLSDVFKTFVPNIKLGGAGVSLNSRENEFRKLVKTWKEKNLNIDFISIYSYPYIVDENILDAGRNSYASEKNYLNNKIMEAKQICEEYQFHAPEFFVTEWSNTLSNRNAINDSCYKAAYIVRNVLQNITEVDSLGYWVGLDLFSDYYDTKRILFGGCGLITRDGIRKAAYYAYRFLNNLEENVLARNENAIITTDHKNKFSICCHNYKHFNFRYYLQDEDEMPVERLMNLYEDNESLMIQINIDHVKNGRYQLNSYSVNTEHGDVQAEWSKIEYYDELSSDEIEYYNQISQPKIFIKPIEVTEHVINIETSLLAQEIQSIIITEL